MKPEILWKLVACSLATVVAALLFSWMGWVSVALVNVPDAKPLWGAIKELRKFHYEKHAK